ncbi:MAG: type VI secretion system lipoprotein TssJ [Pseudomonadota bacterium]
MQFTRRSALACGGAAVLLTACGPEEPAALTVSAQGVAGMNPGPDGNDRPLILQVVQMSGSGAFDGADFFSLQNPQAALGGEFVSVQQIVLQPGASQDVTIPISAGATVVGIVAGFRNPEGKVFRVKTPAPSAPAAVIVAVQAGGLSLQSV